MHHRAWFQGCFHLAAYLLCLPVLAQSPAAPAASFESASIRPASPDAPTDGLGFMIELGKQTPPRGLLTMTGPLAPFIIFAYGVDDEVEARAMRARLPEWAQKQKYTIVARPSQDEPTQNQLRQMMRSLLEERFAMKAHRAAHLGPVNTLILIKPGITGTGLKAHDPSQVCQPRASDRTQAAPDPGEPAPVYCGLELHQTGDGIFHVSMVGVTMPEACTLFGGLAGVLGGRGMNRVVDGTGLQGTWDLKLDFLPERDGPSAADDEPGSDDGGPTFTSGLEKQLGLKLKKGTGQIEDLVVDQVSPPAPD